MVDGEQNDHKFLKSEGLGNLFHIKSRLTDCTTITDGLRVSI